MKDPAVNTSEEGNQTSSTLLDRIRAKDSDAWTRLVYLHSPLVSKWCRAAGLQEADVLDVGQEVFRSVARAIATFRKERPGDSFRAWLRTITANKIKDRYAWNQGQGIGGSDALERMHHVPALCDAEEATTQEEEKRLVIQRALELVLADFAESSRRAFLRVVMQEQTVEAVAQDLGISKAAVYTAKSRILGRLRLEFAELLEWEASRLREV